jgi:hypothetical protein
VQGTPLAALVSDPGRVVDRFDVDAALAAVNGMADTIERA